MEPSQFFIDEYDSPIGKITLAACGDKLCGLWFVGQKYYMAGMPMSVIKNPNAPIFIRTAQWLDRYFSGVRPETSELTISPHGTEFQRRVWRALVDIPYGATATYGDIARRIGAKSPRAVGGAIGHNPISIIIPCHRVIGANGNMTGYAGGLGIKRYLLTHEGAI